MFRQTLKPTTNPYIIICRFVTRLCQLEIKGFWEVNLVLSGKGCVCYLELFEPTKYVLRARRLSSELLLIFLFIYFFVKLLNTAVSGNSLMLDWVKRMHSPEFILC